MDGEEVQHHLMAATLSKSIIIREEQKVGGHVEIFELQHGAQTRHGAFLHHCLHLCQLCLLTLLQVDE